MQKSKINRSKKLEFGDIVSRFSLVIAVVVLAIVFGAAESAYLKFANILIILSSSSLAGIAGLGVTCVCAAGEMDFSCGAAFALGGLSMALLLKMSWLQSYLLAFVITLVILVCYALINSFLHIKVGIPSFIATYAMYALTYGLLKNITDSTPIYNYSTWPSCFTWLGQTYIFGWLPVPVILLAVLSVLMYVFLARMKYGKYMFMIGANSKAARNVGIHVDRVKMVSFILSSVLCGFSGILYTSMVNGASAFFCESMLFNALTVLMLGAIMKKGEYNVPGTIVAAVLLSMITNGMTMLQAETYMDNVVQGAVLLIAVIGMSVSRMRKQRAVERKALRELDALAKESNAPSA